MFWQLGLVRFHIDSDRKRVALEYVVGPHYGRGAVFRVAGQGKYGQLRSEGPVWGVGRLSSYIGPGDIRSRAAHSPHGMKVNSVHDLENWIEQTNQQGLIVVTFVVNEQGKLLVADRSSEHISCSGGHAVLSAGEMFFRVSNSTVEVVDVSNQSTGFCPEPESWPAVAATLD
jgi:hypothetical protein